MSNGELILQNSRSILAISAALSEPRMETYHRIQRTESNADPAALNLYLWNAKISSVMLLPMHVMEVVMRNAISEALSKAFDNTDWPFLEGFLNRLPRAQQLELRQVRDRHKTTNKVIPELKFSFWESLVTSRHDGRVWSHYFWDTFPNSDRTRTVSDNRQAIHSDLENLRKLRNRIAHHEPIFYRDIAADYDRIYSLVELRCTETASWMNSHQSVSEVLALRPHCKQTG